MKIIFLGSPAYSCIVIEKLILLEYKLLALVTQNDKKGKRNIITKTPVSLFGEKNDIKIQKLDASIKQDVEKFANSVEAMDVLFHAVGFEHHGTIMNCSSEEFYNSMNINVYSAYLMTSVFLPKMLEKKKYHEKYYYVFYHFYICYFYYYCKTSN